jgi:hypothetical protein
MGVKAARLSRRLEYQSVLEQGKMSKKAYESMREVT